MILKTRDTELKLIIRYTQNTVCKPMYYTPNLWIHVQRVVWLSEEICNQLELDKELSHKIIKRAMFHDDTEIIAWDIATPVKQNWSQKEKEFYEQKCMNAIPILIDNYQDTLDSDYWNILKEMESSWEWESNDYAFIHAIIEYADKLDALMEVTHELYSWSKSFLNHLWDTYGFNVNWFEYVLARVNRRKKKIEETLWRNITDSWLFNLWQQNKYNPLNFTVGSGFHTLDSITQWKENELYDIWINLHLKKWTPEHKKHLYIQNISY